MHDHTAFERQIGVVLDRMGGPASTFDAMAIARAASVPPSQWRFQSMFSATKFVVAGVIVALFGGFVLTGVMTPPGVDHSPAVGASASAATETEAADPTPRPESTTQADAATTTRSDILSGVRLVTEEVEPGIFRIINDGVRDLPWLPARDGGYCCYYQGAIPIAPDGTPWFLRPDGAFRLGSEVNTPPSDRHGSVVVTGREGSDGQGDLLWYVFKGQLHVADPDADPVVRGIRPASQVAAIPFGSIWALTGLRGGSSVLVRSDDDGATWTRHRVPTNDVDLLAASDDGAVWLQSRRTLYRFDGQHWQDVEIPLIEEGSHHPPEVDVGDDGTAWVQRRIRDPDGSGPADDDVRWDRLQDGRWTPFDVPDDIPSMASPHDGGGQWAVAPDGALWLNPESVEVEFACDGLARFDGSEPRRFLSGLCVYGFGIGPEGAVWALAGADYWKEPNASLETYVIPAQVAMADR